MSQQRILNAIEGLISHLVPADPNDPASSQERHDRCFELVKATLTSAQTSHVTPDVNHASDLIKRRLIQTNPSQALRFSNLYTQLLSVPVLDKKWAILYLLFQLGDSPDPSEPLPVSPALSRTTTLAARDRESLRRPYERGHGDVREQASRSSASASVSRVSAGDEFNDAFQPRGLRRFPPDKSRRGPDEAKAAAAAGGDEMSGVESAGRVRDVSIKSTLLADNAVELNPSETGLLRDLPFTLQGLSSTTLPFSREASLKLPPTLPAPIISLLHTLAEPSLLYRGLDAFVKSPASGLLGQSLRAAMSQELRAYLSLVATLEGQIRRALATLDEDAPRGGIGRAGVTLKRCVVWTRDATMGLRLLSVIAEESRGSRGGGQLISLIHGFSTSHGDPTVAAFAERLLAHVTRPFYDILRRWIYDGELSDPYHEFFVREQDPGAEKHQEAKAKGLSSVWNDKFEVDEAMVPSIVTADLAQKVFLIGKSLHFIRHSCGDSQWVEDYGRAASKELRYGDTATLEAWIDEAYKTTMKRLMHLMAVKFRLFEHLRAMKDYILLGQGDFIALLMESLAPNLDRPAGAQYRHTLTAKLEEAIRGSNAQFASPEVLRRLDARMLQLSHGEMGWDCFTLEYKIDSPVDCVVTEWHNRQYLKVFNFLWRVKRVEFALESAWRKCTTGSRGVLQTPDPLVEQTWKSTRGVLAEMIHWVGQLQYYVLFEVIEASWAGLQRALLREDATLDDLIGAHTTYLGNITRRGLLGAKRSRVPASTAAAQQPPPDPNSTASLDSAAAAAAAEAAAAATATDDERSLPMNQVADILRGILSYRDCVDGLYSWAVSDFTARQNEVIVSSAPRASRKPLTPGLGDDADSGGISNNNPFFGDDAGDGPGSSELPVLQERLRLLGAQFRARVQRLLADLAFQPEHETRFLGIAMNFNEVYQPALVKGRPHRSAATSGRGGGGGGSVSAGSTVLLPKG